MANTTTMSIRLPIKLKEQLDLLATSIKRTKSFCATEAIQNYIETEAWQIAAIQDGIKSADDGKLVEHERVKNWVESWGSANEKEKPLCD